MEVDNENDYNNDQIEYEDEEEYSQHRNQSQTLSKEKIPPNIQLRQPGMKQKRRSKNDFSGRDFTCGCGKTYLSYPALYTHIRTKHNGKAPDGTNASQVVKQTGGRGRPRKNFLVKEDSNRKRYEDDEEFDDISEIKELYEKETIERKELEKKEKNYIEIYGMISDENEENDNEKESHDTGDDKDYHIVNSKIHEWEVNISKIDDVQLLKIDDLLAIFYLNYKDLFGFRLTKLVLFIFSLFRRYINKVGWDYLGELTDVSQFQTEKEYSSTQSGKYIPEIVNDFFEYSVVSKVTSNTDRLISITVLSHLCDWIKRSNISETGVKIEYRK